MVGRLGQLGRFACRGRLKILPTLRDWTTSPCGTCRPSSIEGMYRLYGQVEGAYCRTCVDLVRRQFSKTYFKCDLTKMTGEPVTLWRAKWSASGRYGEADGGWESERYGDRRRYLRPDDGC